MALSEAKKAADKRYTAKLDNIMIRPYREEGAAIRAAAAAAGMSVQAYVLQAVRGWMGREQAGPAAAERAEARGISVPGDGFGVSASAAGQSALPKDMEPTESERFGQMLEDEDLSYQEAKETVDNLRARLSRSPNRARTMKVINRITETPPNGDKSEK